MYTIKFQTQEPLNPFAEGKNLANSEEHTPNVKIYEGDNVHHRAFKVNSLKEYLEWYKKWIPEASNITTFLSGRSPETELSKQDHSCYFQLLSFTGKDNLDYSYVIVFCTECFIMNEAGQTIDSFNC